MKSRAPPPSFIFIIIIIPSHAVASIFQDLVCTLPFLGAKNTSCLVATHLLRVPKAGLVLLPSSSEELLVTTHYPFTSTALTTPEFGRRYPDLSQPSNLAISEGDL